MEIDKSKWDGPYDFYTAIKQWTENNKTIMYQLKSNGITFDRSVMHGGIPTTHNISKRHITKGEWFIEK